MKPKQPVLSADAQGVWREDVPGHHFGIEWGEIYRVIGGKLDGITDIITYIELDFHYGEFLELHDSWPGFTQVVDAITQNVPGIGSDWLQQVASLGRHDQPIVIWERE